MYDPKKVLEICAKATRGPWITNVKHYEHCIVSKPLYDEGINYLISGRCCLSQDDDFVVLARTALPEFAQRVIDSEQEIAKLRAVAETAKRPCIECVLSHRHVNDSIPCEVEIDPDCMFWPIRQAWVALEGGTDDE